MKAATVALVLTIIAFVFLAGFDSRSTLAQTSGAQNGVTLPPDIHPDTLSRMPRANRGDLTTDAEKQAFDRVANRNAKQDESRWLGPTGHRLQVPEVAESFNKLNRQIHEKIGIEDKYVELAIAVVTRETENKEEFINHEPDALKAFGKEIEDVVRLRKSTKGLDEKEAAIIEFGRELFQDPKVSVSSKTFANMERLFGRKSTLMVTLLMGYYDLNQVILRAYDQRMDLRAECSLPHMGCDVNKRSLSSNW